MPTNFIDDKLAASGLLRADIDAQENVDFTGQPNGFRIPYYHPDGTEHTTMWRKRLERPSPTAGKYTQPSTQDLVKAGRPETDATHPYLNPHMWGGATWAQLAPYSKRLLIVEGELKAACAMKLLRMAAIGIGGCDNGVVKNVQGVAHVHPVIRGLIQPGDRVEVVLDGDLRTNPNVERAAGTLKRALLRLGVRPVFVLLPIPARGVGGGLDDWLVAQAPADRSRAFEALPRTTGEDFAEDKVSVADYFGLAVGKKGIALPLLDNILIILEKHERYTSRYYFDILRGNLYKNGRTGPVAVDGSSAVREARWMYQRIGMVVSKAMMQDALAWMANHPRWRRNLLLESLPAWDGTPRLETMFIDGWGEADNDYTRAVGKNWLTSAIARAMDPGSKVDTMLVLVGPQGIGKSQSLEMLGSSFYVQTHSQAHEKDFILALHRGWLIDMAELSSMNHADAAQIKGVISTATDHIRPPYGNVMEEWKRHCVIVGTTNEERFLRDRTGNRRFWPIGCRAVDLKWIDANRLQLLAEAKHRVDAGENWWDMPASTAAVQESRMEVHPWDAPLAAILSSTLNARIVTIGAGRYYFITADEIFGQLGYEVKDRKAHFYRDLGHAVRRVASAWENYKLQQPISVQGGTLEIARGYRLPVTGTPSAVVVPIKKF